MTDFERDVLKELGTIGERLATLETKVSALPCLTNCPAPKNNHSWKRWGALGVGFGVGLRGGGAGVVKLLRG